MSNMIYTIYNITTNKYYTNGGWVKSFYDAKHFSSIDEVKFMIQALYKEKGSYNLMYKKTDLTKGWI